ncbi:exopolysaccharide biosynthesis polyprenyl glycosylphosphotransferase [Brevundimonas sp. M20]|uniref:exopolysaccharide biosynthesis polyprenyl glycosylphosphotransferase n=1 Tax=Brevundimonas sp. M20 TaxID=2591463 RepID=UPI00114617E5|nr:exopolysaccharide biosynthesis polyprenyl glycosylphosphotransferase [Brevundimonas sp. M20]QDH73641.1 exopolysaccharide biosynthesis polyprenyl glycosylphosphotransferase [Brevundimonas sp. M20]
MTDAASRLSSHDAPPRNAAVRDAAKRVAKPVSAKSGGAARRGPFRPEVWLNARQRHASRLAAHYFRAFDVLTVTGLTLLCAWAAASDALIHVEVSRVAPFVLGALTTLSLLRSLGRYRFSRGQDTATHMASVAGVCAVGAVVAIVTGVLLRPGEAAQWSAWLVWAGLTFAALMALHLTWCAMVARWRASGALTPNIVLVGATRHAEALIREALKRRDLNVLGIFDDRLARSPNAIEGVPVLGTADDLLTHKMTPYVDRVVLAIDPRAEARVRELTSRLGALPNEVTLLVEPDGDRETASALDRLAAAPLADIQGATDPDRRAFNKRLQDLIIALIALIALAPVMGLIALAIRLDSPGPIFFRQRRHGFNQEEIIVWKFRSMRQETADATASRQVTHDDDRITRIGKFIRKTSLDELPQLLNVITGEMSLVGPRPHAIGMKTGHVESARLVAEYAHRHRIKPGMTGWAAVNGSRGPLHTAQDVRRRVQLDIDYVERQSLWMDLWIMAVTVPVLLGDRAAVR